MGRPLNKAALIAAVLQLTETFTEHVGDFPTYLARGDDERDALKAFRTGAGAFVRLAPLLTLPPAGPVAHYEAGADLWRVWWGLIGPVPLGGATIVLYECARALLEFHAARLRDNVADMRTAHAKCVSTAAELRRWLGDEEVVRCPPGALDK